MTPEQIEPLFTRDESYVFARWGRPLAPIVFGVDDATLGVVKGALEAVCAVSGHLMTEHDPELGANLMFFFFRDWGELLQTPDLDRLVPDLGALVERLQAQDATQYRLFRFDEAGAIRAAFVFLRIGGALAEQPAEDLALSQAVQVMLLWSDAAFSEASPLARIGDGVILRPEIAGLLRAAYDPVMPPVSQDRTHALRLAARLGRGQ
jgi:hypothetical protein